MSIHRPGRAFTAVCSAVLVAPFLLAIAAPASAAAAPRVTIPNSRPDWATSTRAVGTPSAAAKVSVRVVLNLRDPGGAEQLVRQVSNPEDAAYGSYLTARQFNARFGPTGDAVQQVSRFLTDAGIAVDGVAAGNRWLTATGSVAALNAAFRTSLKNYTVGGRIRRAPASEASVPSSVAGLIAGVTGLAQDTAIRRPATRSIVPDPVPARAAARGAAPAATRPPPSTCSDYWGEHQQTLPPADGGRTAFNTYICGYTPAQLRTAYGSSAAVAHGLTGKGVTVAIIDAYGSPTMLADANAYSAAVGEPGFTAGQYTETLFQPFDLQDECGGEAGWNGEETLDVEAVHGMAPGAKVHYIGAQNCDNGIDDALNYVVQNHVANIVSNSYGNTGEDVPAAEIALEHSIFVQAALQGIGLYFSSGDDGDNVINGLPPQPDYSASDPTGDRGRRYQPAAGPPEPEECRARLGNVSGFRRLQRGDRGVHDPAAGRVRIRRRWRGEHALRPALVPGGCRAARSCPQRRAGQDAGVTGHLRGRGPVHRVLLRRDG